MTHEWALRPSSEVDASWMAELRAEVMREDLERLGRWDPVRVRHRFLDAFIPENTSVTQVAGEDVGLIAVRPEGGSLWIEHFYLEPSHQGQGLGSQVLHHIMARRNQDGPFRLNVLQGSPARHLYERNGFAFDHEDLVDVFLVADKSETTVLRGGRDTDRPACIALWVNACGTRDGQFHAGVAGRASSKFEDPAAWIVAERSGVLAGFALATKPGTGLPSDPSDAAVLGLLAVDPAAQGSGLGARVLRAITSEMRESGHTQLVLRVLTDNSSAIRLYETAGWEPLGPTLEHSLLKRPFQTYRLDLPKARVPLRATTDT